MGCHKEGHIHPRFPEIAPVVPVPGNDCYITLIAVALGGLLPEGNALSALKILHYLVVTVMHNQNQCQVVIGIIFKAALETAHGLGLRFKLQLSPVLLRGPADLKICLIKKLGRRKDKPRTLRISHHGIIVVVFIA